MVPENEAVVRGYMKEVWSEGNFTMADELVAADHVHHLGDDTLRGPHCRRTFADVAPTGRQVAWTGCDCFRLRFGPTRRSVRLGRRRGALYDQLTSSEP